MKIKLKLLIAATLASMSLGTLSIGASAAEMSAVEQGKQVAFDRRKGNCLACHMVDDGALPGNAGPPLVAMKARFPDKAKLREQIWDPMIRNPTTIMPPFGKHNILTEKEIDLIVEYLYTL